MTTPEVLRAAADHIERAGWWDGSSYRGAFKSCAVQAINVCTMRESVEVYQSAMDAFIAHIGGQMIAHWNDRQPDGATVCKALRACADALGA
jgi:hypothetical protein